MLGITVVMRPIYALLGAHPPGGYRHGVARPASFVLSNVSSGPADALILDSIDLDLTCEGITVVAGPSGAGKSSLLRLLNRLADPTEGTIRFGGRAVSSLDPVELRRRVGMVFQRPPIFAGSVADNLRVADPSITDPQALDALDRVGLDPTLLERWAGDLSGGEAQRMCFARALLTRPEVLLADEPTASLDAAARDTIEALARQLADDGMPIVWVSHDVAQLRRLADNVIVLDAGRVLAVGTMPELDHHEDDLVRELVGAP